MNQFDKIMIVDDDEDIRQIAEMSLAQLGGFEVCACESGASAVAALSDFQPELILLDANMPDLDGPQTLQKIRENSGFEQVPIVFITGETRSDEVAQFKKLGAIAVIEKPFDPMTLPDQIKALGAELS